MNTCAGTISFASAQLCRMDGHLPDTRVIPASSPPSLQDLLLESQASRNLSSIFLNNEASDIPGPYPGRPVFDLNTPVYLPSGNQSEDMDVRQTNLNTDEVTNHSDLLSQAVQEIYSPLADTVISDSSDRISENGNETVINTDTHNTNANLIHKLDLRNVQLYTRALRMS